jgi:hypothetical protein
MKVQKTISLPYEMAKFAEDNSISLSEIVQQQLEIRMKRGR